MLQETTILSYLHITGKHTKCGLSTLGWTVVSLKHALSFSDRQGCVILEKGSEFGTIHCWLYAKINNIWTHFMGESTRLSSTCLFKNFLWGVGIFETRSYSRAQAVLGGAMQLRLVLDSRQFSCVSPPYVGIAHTSHLAWLVSLRKDGFYIFKSHVRGCFWFYCSVWYRRLSLFLFQLSYLFKTGLMYPRLASNSLYSQKL